MSILFVLTALFVSGGCETTAEKLPVAQEPIWMTIGHLFLNKYLFEKVPLRKAMMTDVSSQECNKSFNDFWLARHKPLTIKKAHLKKKKTTHFWKIVGFKPRPFFPPITCEQTSFRQVHSRITPPPSSTVSSGVSSSAFMYGQAWMSLCGCFILSSTTCVFVAQVVLLRRDWELITYIRFPFHFRLFLVNQFLITSFIHPIPMRQKN